MADESSGLTRRTVIGAGAAALASVAVSDLFSMSHAFAKPGPTNGVGYFGRFGVTEQLIRSTLAAAMSKGGDYADVFFQHRVNNQLALEDGLVTSTTREA
jgi:TldD protein